MIQELRTIELFAGVGGFRVGLESASPAYNVIWSNQWKPSTKKQDASMIYCGHFGNESHSNKDINLVPTEDIPDCDMLVGGFPCQDYSVASTLDKSKGIEGKKGVLWWQIYRILKGKGGNRPKYLFLENVDRLLLSPSAQRGRDFAIILSSLCDLGYTVEWRVINAADYGMPQKRKRTYILAYLGKRIREPLDWLSESGVMAKSFQCDISPRWGTFTIEGELPEISKGFNKGNDKTPFLNAGLIDHRTVFTINVSPIYNGKKKTLGDILVEESDVPESFFVPDSCIGKWKEGREKKKTERISKEGFKYVYSQGAMSFPDRLDMPSRTITTSEGGSSASRMKHIVKCPSGRYRRLIPTELERLNMFPDGWTGLPGISDSRRAFLMGNALVVGVVEKIGKTLLEFIENGKI